MFQKYRFKRLSRNVARYIKVMDFMMTALGVNRNSRRHFWREFVRDSDVRSEFVDDMMKIFSRLKGGS
uniref:Uncharacterized protein n=1 Tax=viral metagenome TaxID=1070528 RepID=A0A6H1ZSI5_9ZZZZ